MAAFQTTRSLSFLFAGKGNWTWGIESPKQAPVKATQRPRQVHLAMFTLLLLLVSVLNALTATETTNSAFQEPDSTKAKKNWTETSLEEVETAAGQGQRDAAFELFVRYNPGTERVSDNPEALRWLGKAAEGGHAYAQALFGWYYDRHANMPAAIHWYRRSAEQNWPGSQCNLALCYLNGWGVEVDEERGLEWMRKAVDQDHLYALYKLSELYASGVGEPRSLNERPFELLLRCAKRGYQEAFQPLSFRYQHGLGTERDLVRAAEWYYRASRGNPRHFTPAGKTVDLASEKVRSVSPFIRMLSYYTQAALLNPAALEYIGDSYVAGREVPRNPSRALLWLTLASQHGAAGALGKLSQLEPLATPEELGGTKKLLPQLTQELNQVASSLLESARDHQ